MCYGMSTGAELWLAYEMVEKTILKIVHCNSVGFLDILFYLFILSGRVKAVRPSLPLSQRKHKRIKIHMRYFDYKFY